MKIKSPVLVNSTIFKLQKHLQSPFYILLRIFRSTSHIIRTVEQTCAIVFFPFFFNDNKDQYLFHMTGVLFSTTSYEEWDTNC